MQAVCCVAKVNACNTCAKSKAHNHSADHVVITMRSTMAAEQMNIHIDKLNLGNQRLCVKNHTISAATETAHNTPIMVLL